MANYSHDRHEMARLVLINEYCEKLEEAVNTSTFEDDFLFKTGIPMLKEGLIVLLCDQELLLLNYDEQDEDFSSIQECLKVIRSAHLRLRAEIGGPTVPSEVVDKFVKVDQTTLTQMFLYAEERDRKEAMRLFKLIRRAETGYEMHLGQSRKAGLSTTEMLYKWVHGPHKNNQ